MVETYGSYEDWQGRPLTQALVVDFAEWFREGLLVSTGDDLRWIDKDGVVHKMPDLPLYAAYVEPVPARTWDEDRELLAEALRLLDALAFEAKAVGESLKPYYISPDLIERAQVLVLKYR